MNRLHCAITFKCGTLACWIAAAVVFVMPGARADFDADRLPLNQIQFVGTHNSYHVGHRDALSRPGGIIDTVGWNYTHPPLDVQLDHGVRGLELDVYAHPGETLVMHVPIYDPGTTCRTFADGLRTVRAWSEKHPRHVPVVILVELKDESVPLATVRPFDEAALDQLDSEIRSVFPPEGLITPDDVRGDAPTLARAVEEKGWPALAWARGRVMLVLHTRGRAAELYTKDRPSLQGRAMMLESQEGKPFAAVFIRNNPRDPRIPRLVRQGYFVRTTCAGSEHGRPLAELNARAQAALDSGANFISTDYPAGEADADSGYELALPDKTTARLNPLFAGAAPGNLPVE